MDDLDRLRILAITGLVLWTFATYFITWAFVRVWYRGRQDHYSPLFVISLVGVGVTNVAETALTVMAAYEIGIHGLTGIYLLLIWPIARALSYMVIGWLVLHRKTGPVLP